MEEGQAVTFERVSWELICEAFAELYLDLWIYEVQ